MIATKHSTLSQQPDPRRSSLARFEKKRVKIGLQVYCGFSIFFFVISLTQQIVNEGEILQGALSVYLISIFSFGLYALDGGNTALILLFSKLLLSVLIILLYYFGAFLYEIISVEFLTPDENKAIIEAINFILILSLCSYILVSLLAAQQSYMLSQEQSQFRYLTSNLESFLPLDVDTETANALQNNNLEERTHDLNEKSQQLMLQTNNNNTQELTQIYFENSKGLEQEINLKKQ